MWREKGEYQRQQEKHNQNQVAGRSAYIQEEVEGKKTGTEVFLYWNIHVTCIQKLGVLKILWTLLQIILTNGFRSWTCFVKWERDMVKRTRS